jgi:REP element-mobilizing transposase RayT
MRDHVHIVFTPYDGQTLSTIMDGMKGASSHLINRATGREGHLWLGESFDRILRSSENLRQKCEYICNNPVRAGLVSSPEEWPWLWRSWIEGIQDSRGRLSST